ncbi:hypothetical protein BDZ45DRAFT_745249 [Acephala macrosclerotiorum]|nr:hypothetical protein BDZ45DRAFT_745249 [Acephala macrosclerotiorum]
MFVELVKLEVEHVLPGEQGKESEDLGTLNPFICHANTVSNATVYDRLSRGEGGCTSGWEESGRVDESCDRHREAKFTAFQGQTNVGPMKVVVTGVVEYAYVHEAVNSVGRHEPPLAPYTCVEHSERAGPAVETGSHAAAPTPTVVSDSAEKKAVIVNLEGDGKLVDAIQLAEDSVQESSICTRSQLTSTS